MLHWIRQFLEQKLLICGFYAFWLFFIVGFLYHLCISLEFKIKINAECWFCMKKTRVCLAKRNSWTCAHCEQYNGFSKSGSYNKVIDEHYQLKEERYCQPSSSKASYERHRLCNECNKNQEMKIKLLADFVPLDENNFDKEVAEFRKHLEGVYMLCSLCELVVDKVLEKPSDFSFGISFIEKGIASIGLGKTLIKFGDYGQPPIIKKSAPSKPVKPEAASTHISIWISNMLHTFQLILFLVIIGLLVTILSMPVTLSYSAEFNNFSLNIVVNQSA